MRISQSRPVTVSRIQAVRAITFSPVNPPVTRTRHGRGRARSLPVARLARSGARSAPASPAAAGAAAGDRRARGIRVRSDQRRGIGEQDMAKRFVDAWAKQDFAAMHEELSPSAQEKYGVNDLASQYLEAQQASTAVAIAPGDVDEPTSANGTDIVDVDIGIRTMLFGRVDGTLRLPLDGEKIAWEPHLTFANLQSGEQVGRRLTLPRRASILAKNGTPLARGPVGNRTSPLGSDAVDVAGETGVPDAELRAKIEQEGYPADQEAGVSGLGSRSTPGWRVARADSSWPWRREHPDRTSRRAPAGGSSPPPPKHRDRTSGRPSSPASRRRRSTPSPAAPAAWPSSMRETARSSPWPAPPSPRLSRRVDLQGDHHHRRARAEGEAGRVLRAGQRDQPGSRTARE